MPVNFHAVQRVDRDANRGQTCRALKESAGAVIYLIRHPAPADGTGLCHGRRDVRVDAAAVRDAARAIRHIIPAGVLDHAPLFSSPSTRCLALARELALPRQPWVTEDLAEIDFGSWEGLSWDAVPRNELDAWGADLWHYRPGGAESAAMVAERWQRFAARLASTHDTPDTIAVTHAGVIRVALASAGRSDLQFPVAFGSVHTL